MSVRISRDVLDEIGALARACPDSEICGLLTGRADSITGLIRAENVASDRAHRFEVDPVVLIAAHRQARAGGPVPCGCYHSHPGGGAVPSACDARLAMADGGLWLILGQSGEGMDFALWRACGQGVHGMFRREEMEIG